jgi:hypothetical protein
VFITTKLLRAAGFKKRPSYWYPSVVLTAEEHGEFERRRAGRVCYYADDKGWPIPE